MQRSINSIVDEINDLIAVSYSNETLYNIAVLQPDENNQTFPMTRSDDDEGIQISPLDTQGLQIYHRLLETEVKPLDGAKGKKSYQLAVHSMKLVGVGYRKNIETGNDWNNQEVANDVMAILGRNGQLSSKEILQVNGQVVTDKLEVLKEEFAGFDDDFDSRTLDLIAFSIEYTIQQKQICGGATLTQLRFIDYTNNEQDVTTAFSTMTPTLLPTGATATYTAPSLPAGLSIDANTGIITQTDFDSIPFGLSVFNVTVTGTGSFGGSLIFEVIFCKREETSGTVNSLTYDNDGQTIWQETGTSGVFVNMNPTLDPCNATGVYSSLDLPSGLSLNSSTGIISVDTYASIPSGNSNFTITFTGNGSFTGSANFNGSLTKNTLWTPAELGAAVVAWWDFSRQGTQTDDGVLFSQVNDRSANAQHAVQVLDTERPYVVDINGEQAGMFTASVMEATLDQDLNQEFHLFVLREGQGNEDQQTFIGQSSTDYLLRSLAGARNWFTRNAGSTLSMNMTFEEYLNCFGSASFVHMNYNGASSRLLVDGGESFDSGLVNAGTSAFDGTATFGIGSRQASSAADSLGQKIGQILFISGALTQENRQRLEGWVAWLYSTVDKLASGHPYKTLPPFI